jgi:hypothetical protein
MSSLKDSIGPLESDLRASPPRINVYRAYESGEFCPSPETLKRLEKALGFPAAFFEGDDLPMPTKAVPTSVSCERSCLPLQGACLAT